MSLGRWRRLGFAATGVGVLCAAAPIESDPTFGARLLMDQPEFVYLERKGSESAGLSLFDAWKAEANVRIATLGSLLKWNLILGPQPEIEAALDVACRKISGEFGSSPRGKLVWSKGTGGLLGGRYRWVPESTDSTTPFSASLIAVGLAPSSSRELTLFSAGGSCSDSIGQRFLGLQHRAASLMAVQFLEVWGSDRALEYCAGSAELRSLWMRSLAKQLGVALERAQEWSQSSEALRTLSTERIAELRRALTRVRDELRARTGVPFPAYLSPAWSQSFSDPFLKCLARPLGN